MRTFRILVAGWILGVAVIVVVARPWAEAETRTPMDVSAEMPGPARMARERSASSEEVETPAISRVMAEPVVLETSKPSASGLIVPVDGVSRDELRDDYAQPRSGGRTHAALDILAPLGTPVVAVADGTIRKLFTSKAGGLTIYQFDRDEKRLYYYAHLDRYDPAIAEGQFVAQGTVIGYVGTTGNARGTPHLHFSVEDLPPTKEWWKGTPVNPYPLLR